MKLTNEEKEKILTMYWGQHVLKFSKTAPATQYVNSTMLSYAYKNDDCCLELKSLSSITEDDAIEVAKIAMYSPDLIDEEMDMNRVIDYPECDEDNIDRQATHIIIAVDDGCFTGYVTLKFDGTVFLTDENMEKQQYCPASYIIHQHLIQKGYAVPLWFGINHWANGKDAFQLGIAIEKPAP